MMIREASWRVMSVVRQSGRGAGPPPETTQHSWEDTGRSGSSLNVAWGLHYQCRRVRLDTRVRVTFDGESFFK